MTVYRLGDTKARLPEDVEWSKAMTAYVNALIDQEVLVPVEPCKHGKIDGHWIVTPSPRLEVEGIWCPGAGIGEKP